MSSALSVSGLGCGCASQSGGSQIDSQALSVQVIQPVHFVAFHRSQKSPDSPSPVVRFPPYGAISHYEHRCTGLGMSADFRLFPSVPSSAWDRISSKLCFASRANRSSQAEHPTQRHHTSSSVYVFWHASKRSFGDRRSQAELGIERKNGRVAAASIAQLQCRPAFAGSTACQFLDSPEKNHRLSE